MDGGDLRLMSDKGCLPGRDRVRADYGRLDLFDEVPSEEAGQGEVRLQAAGAGGRVLDGAVVERLTVLWVLGRPHVDLLGQLLG